MNELKALTWLELRGLCGLNRWRHAGDPKEKNRFRLLGGAWIFLILMVCFYVGGLVYGLWLLGLSQIAPAYLTMLASLLILAFGLFQGGNAIFGSRGYDMLSSLPVGAEAVVLSRILALYAQDLVLTLVILLPGTAVYSYLCRPGVGFYAAAAVGSLLIPAIPLVISVLFGTLIMAVSARMKHKSLVQTALMLVFVLVILLGSFRMEAMEESITPEALANLAQRMGELTGSLYLPARWLGNALLGSTGDFLLFAGVSLGMLAVATMLIARNFHAVMGKLGSFSARSDYKIGAMESRGLLKTLYLRELRRYFSSSIYVANTIIGPIMGTIMAGALCFGGMEAVDKEIPLDVNGLLPIAFGAVFTMMTTTSVSVSMEGRQFWVVQSLPVPAKTLFDSKILLNLSLMLPFYLVSEVFLVIAAKPSLPELLWLILIPALIMGFVVVFGITVNLKLCRFDWEKEEQIVKQSASAALGGFAGILVSAVFIGVLFLLPESAADLAKGGMCILLALGTAFFYCENNKTQLQLL